MKKKEMVKVTIQPEVLKIFIKEKFEAMTGAPYPKDISKPYTCLVFKELAEKVEGRKSQ
jgi:hypothetical protein